MNPEILSTLNHYFLGVTWDEIKDQPSNELIGYQGILQGVLLGQDNNILPNEIIQVLELKQKPSDVFRVQITGFYPEIQVHHARLDTALELAIKQHQQTMQAVGERLAAHQSVSLRALIDGLLGEFNQQYGVNLQIERLSDYRGIKGTGYQEATIIEQQYKKRFRVTARAVTDNQKALEVLRSSILSQVRSMMGESITRQ